MPRAPDRQASPLPTHRPPCRICQGFTRHDWQKASGLCEEGQVTSANIFLLSTDEYINVTDNKMLKTKLSIIFKLHSCSHPWGHIRPTAGVGLSCQIFPQSITELYKKLCFYSDLRQAHPYGYLSYRPFAFGSNITTALNLFALLEQN